MCEKDPSGQTDLRQGTDTVCKYEYLVTSEVGTNGRFLFLLYRDFTFFFKKNMIENIPMKN